MTADAFFIWCGDFLPLRLSVVLIFSFFFSYTFSKNPSIKNTKFRSTSLDCNNNSIFYLAIGFFFQLFIVYFFFLSFFFSYFSSVSRIIKNTKPRSISSYCDCSDFLLLLSVFLFFLPVFLLLHKTQH